MERNNTKLIVMSQYAMMTWGPILEQLFEQCHCSDRFSVCGFKEFLLHSEYGTPYIIVLTVKMTVYRQLIFYKTFQFA